MGRIKPLSAQLRDAVREYLSRSGGSNEGQQDSITRTLETMPSRYRKSYLKAIMGKSRPHAVKVHCLECVGWKKADVVTCETMACVFWPYRPYVKKGEAKRRILNAEC